MSADSEVLHALKDGAGKSPKTLLENLTCLGEGAVAAALFYTVQALRQRLPLWAQSLPEDQAPRDCLELMESILRGRSDCATRSELQALHLKILQTVVMRRRELTEVSQSFGLSVAAAAEPLLAENIMDARSSGYLTSLKIWGTTFEAAEQVVAVAATISWLLEP